MYIHSLVPIIWIHVTKNALYMCHTWYILQSSWKWANFLSLKCIIEASLSEPNTYKMIYSMSYCIPFHKCPNWSCPWLEVVQNWSCPWILIQWTASILWCIIQFHKCKHIQNCLNFACITIYMYIIIPWRICDDTHVHNGACKCKLPSSLCYLCRS